MLDYIDSQTSLRQEKRRWNNRGAEL
jgi:hypothetical protein